MKKIKVFYVYGYGQFPDTCIANDLKTELGKKYEVICDYYAQYSPKEALKDINTYIEQNDIDILVGDELGAYLLTLSDNDLPKILINPIFDVVKTLEEFNAQPHIINFYKEYEGKPIYNDNIHCMFMSLKDYDEYNKIIKDCKIITHINEVVEKIKHIKG